MSNFINGNHIKLLRNGEEYFPALLTAIAAAAHEIYLETYIFQADETGQKIAQALIAAAQRGVRVCLLLDGFGSQDLPLAYIQSLGLAGINVMFYRAKISPWTFKKNRLRRLHRKLVVIDQKVGFVGGINIMDDQDAPFSTAVRVDYAVRIEGALLPMLYQSVHQLWRHIAWSQLRPFKQIKPYAAPIKSHHTADVAQFHQIKAALVLRDNIKHRRDIEQAYLAAIKDAKKEIIIANAYFVPGRAFRSALLEAVARGVSVKLLLQGRVEYFGMFATHAFYSMFLQNGIAIFEYRKSYMHSKVAVIDSQWATVGSSNLDPFSLLLAREANVVVSDHAFASALRADILNTIKDGATKLSHENWRHRHVAGRLASWLAYSCLRVFLGLIGYSGEQ
jgi:cardiolipin synthase